uniref:Integrase core domain containing protein n=1 Tax=Solanum tuberosum TaxID=4113 RepID=M1DJP9_SOLTU
MSGSESAPASGSQSAHSSQSESVHVSGSGSKSATASGENNQAASSDEATSSESIPVPQNDDPTPVAAEPNRWCVEGQWQIYRDAKMINDKQKNGQNYYRGAQSPYRKLGHCPRNPPAGSNLHKCDWMARGPRGRIVRRWCESSMPHMPKLSAGRLPKGQSS